MKTFEVPGIALAIVKDDAVVIAKGYGVRKLGDPAPVDAKTLFGIASNTKVFTATALGMLVEEQKIEWDAPVIRYLPGFAMWDPYVTRELTIRDLLVHRSGLGLGAGDLLWWPSSTYDRKEIARRLRYIQPATSFRTALRVRQRVVSGGGRSDRSDQRAVVGDLRRHTNPRQGRHDRQQRSPFSGGSRRQRRRDARADRWDREADRAVRQRQHEPGGRNQFVGGGHGEVAACAARTRQAPDGSRLFSEATARQLATIVTPIPASDPPPDLLPLKANFRGYALGLDIRDYRGHKLVSTPAASRLRLAGRDDSGPERRRGGALTNQESTMAFDAIVAAHPRSLSRGGAVRLD